MRRPIPAAVKTTLGLLSAVLLTGCAAALSPPPSVVDRAALRPLAEDLETLPPPAQRVYVAVYDFPDQTGQFKPSETAQTLSRAVAQGAAAVLVDVLEEVGGGAWFTVVERTSLQNLLRERQLIEQTRKIYLRPDGTELPPPPPLRYAGVIFEGGIIGFDTNTLTGGLGARFLGIGGDVEYREDIVTVYLRAVSSQTGEVLRSVRASKRIVSYGIGANAFKFIAFRELLEAEGGWTSNEPGLVALRQAIELAVYALIVEGSENNLWRFADLEQQAALVADWQERTRIRGLDEPLPPLPPATRTQQAARSGEATDPSRHLVSGTQPPPGARVPRTP